MNPRQHPLPSKPALLRKVVGTVACGSRFGKGQAQLTALRNGRRGTKQAIDYFWQEGRIVGGHAIADFHSDLPAFGRPSSRIARDATRIRGPNGSIGTLGTLRRSLMAKSLSVVPRCVHPVGPRCRIDEEMKNAITGHQGNAGMGRGQSAAFGLATLLQAVGTIALPKPVAGVPVPMTC